MTAVLPTNNRALITRHGGADVFQVVEAPTPAPGPNEVVVRVEAAGVAFADVLMRRGLYPNTPQTPFVPGYDIAGTVEAVGANVTIYHEGDRVAALTQFGGYSKFVRLAAWRCVAVPDDVDMAEAVSLVLNYVTAFQMLHRVTGIMRGESILVHGAAGGVGTALLQLAKLHDVRCYGTASRAKHDIVRANGGTPIDYRREDFVDRVLTLTGDGVDAAYDPIGGDHWVRSYRALRLGGTLVMYGASAALQNGERNPASLLPGVLKLGALFFVPDGRRQVGYFLPTSVMQDRRAFREDLMILLRMLADGEIKPLIGARYPLSAVNEAHERLEAADTTGKIVLEPDT
ncbi:MAG: medium chain dehydrogenase/reductase family protein [Chloroflexota bacterium]